MPQKIKGRGGLIAPYYTAFMYLQQQTISLHFISALRKVNMSRTIITGLWSRGCHFTFSVPEEKAMLKKITVLLSVLFVYTNAAAIPAPPPTLEQRFNNGWKHTATPNEYWSKTIHDNGRPIIIQVFMRGKSVLLVTGFTCGFHTTATSYTSWRPQEKLGRRVTCDQKVLTNVEIPDSWNRGAGVLPLAVEQRMRAANED